MTSAVRPRRDSDIDACVRILADVHAGDGYPVNWPGDPAGWLTPEQLIGVWVAELDGEVAGHAALTCAARHRTCEVSRLYVSPGARGHRLGQRLMDRLMAAARERGLRPVLDVVATDTAATALYERLGWVRTGTVDEWWEPGQLVRVHHYEAPAEHHVAQRVTSSSPTPWR